MSVTMRVVFLLILPLAVFAIPRNAVSQPASAQAEHLFREGKKLMSEGNIKAACDAFEGSYAKDPAVSTLLNLADCREKNQQYASAWAHFVEAGRQTLRDASMAALHKTATERAAAVEGRLSYLIINVPDEARVEGLAITKNGVAVDAVEWNRDIPVDGGMYVIEGKAPAYEPWSTKVTVGNAKDKQSVNVPRFREAIAGTVVETPPSAPERSSSWSGKRKLALGLGAVGVVALGGGLAFELKSGSTYDDAKAATDNGQRHELTDQANQQRDIGMMAGAVGVVALGAGAYLWLTGGASEHAVAITPSLSDDAAELAVWGRF